MDLGAMLTGKQVLVTGASSGLGENFARLAIDCKANMVIGARRKNRLDEFAKELERPGSPQISVLEMDVTSEQSLDQAFAELDISGAILEVVVSNAGGSIGSLSLVLTASDSTR
ncbi:MULTISPECIES: SDR family NAD(P)-dependent oxidoreductase [Pseudomonadaceae]|uniref:Short-chain dehydrogenase/reductase SDR n=1 Tax=Pseudomonas putida (strain W619) TaxID=390235 RepID=B1JB61_PSEPW|nr:MULTISPECIES: SDR family NAD(P)-dependent oxidoreductase [Pseudomonadaceae]AJG12537.1 short-chain dehydrogenase/reductase SDR [Pseudomonas plecoglossicida]EIU1414784.1 SDR family NAD(P)-dependent oxidoreductase [Pseudomonas aeruginosa]EKT4450887.1 SDR family NAD(P)-dependent oxidoreductase [Pseudomonas putida]MBW6313706.1 SDR family NAD(P)-dependent oxidoreductase [Pseudomonas aeruginosa]MCE0874942.1 SDR family NAD(P)-dependent oxidoreductase [Pseudomonas monteilii]